MSFIVKSGGKNFTPAPEGPQRTVCVDIVDLGTVVTRFQDKEGRPKIQHHVRIVHQSEKKMSNGKPFLISQQYNATLGTSEKPSKLREHLEGWRGRAFTDEEAESFDLDDFIGMNGYTLIVHKPRDKGGVWANIKTMMPSLPGPQLVADSYVRMKDRPKEESGQQPAPQARTVSTPIQEAAQEPDGPYVETEFDQDSGDDIPF